MVDVVKKSRVTEEFITNIANQSIKNLREDFVDKIAKDGAKGDINGYVDLVNLNDYIHITKRK
jgi:hypothetical protein